MNPMLVTVVVIIGVAAAAWRWRRHESPLNIALDGGGYVIFLIGLQWAAAMGLQPFLAAGVASLGMTLIAEGYRRTRLPATARA